MVTESTAGFRFFTIRSKHGRIHGLGKHCIWFLGLNHMTAEHSDTRNLALNAEAFNEKAFQKW